MTLSFDITRDDLLAFVREVQAGQRILKRSYLRGFAGVPLAGLIVVAVVRPSDFLHAVVLVVACSGLYAAVWFGVWPIHLARSARALLDDGLMRREIGRHTIELQPEGILETVEWGYVYRRWTVLERLGQTPLHVFVSVLGQGPVIVVPRRAFASSVEEADFIQVVTSRLGPAGAAQQGVAADEAR